MTAQSVVTGPPAQRSGDYDNIGGPPDRSWRPENALDRVFKYSWRGSTLGKEIRGGLSTFFVMSYIVILNPIILTSAKDISGHTLNFSQVVTSTSLVAVIMTLLMGLTANMPIAVASGMGLNAVFAYSVAAKMTWPATWGLAIWSGILIMALVLTGFREAMANAIPDSLKRGIAAGIGVFIALIGLVDAGFVRAGAGTPVALGQDGVLRGWPTLVFAFGLVLTLALWMRKTKGALLIGIIVTTFAAWLVNHFEHVSGLTNASGKVVNPSGWQLNVPNVPHNPVALPDFGLVGHISMLGAFKQAGVATAIILLFTVFLSDFFDATGTITGVANRAGLKHRGTIPNFGRALFVDGAGAAVGGFAGASTATAYVESNAGVAEGARTGLASVVTGLCFVAALFLSPLINTVPSEAATPALVMVGVIMLSQLREVDWDDSVIFPATALTVFVIPFTYSITDGVGAGILTFVLGRVVQRRWREIHPLIWIIALMFAVYFALYPIQRWLGVS